MSAAMQVKALRAAGFSNADIVATAKLGLVDELAPWNQENLGV